MLVRDIEAEIERRLAAPRPLPEFTVTTLPPANQYAGCAAWVTDGAADKYVVISNGTAWFYAEGTAV